MMNIATILDYAEAQLSRARLHRQKKAEQRAEADAARDGIDRMTDRLVAEINERFKDGL